jgi:hypothetical protein
MTVTAIHDEWTEAFHAGRIEPVDWRAPRHWSKRQKPCLYCKNPTNLRDDAGQPAHKMCAELYLIDGPPSYEAEAEAAESPAEPEVPRPRNRST